MTVTAVSAVSSHSQESSQQQSGFRQDLLDLQEALSTGNLATAQRALSNFQQDLQGIRPQQNGVRASATNPQGTMRADVQALRSALDAGDLDMAEEAFVRIQQDSQPRIPSPTPLAARGTSPLPQDENSGESSASPSAAASSSKPTGNLIDVTA